MSDFPNLHNPDGHIGSSEPPHSEGDVYCNTCGQAGATGKMDIYDVATDTWDRDVDCFNHQPVAH